MRRMASRSRPLSGKLIEPAGELRRHAVELLGQRGELVTALDLDRQRQVAAAQTPGRLEKVAQTSLQCARGERREGEREYQERDYKRRGDGATAPHRPAGRRQSGQHRHGQGARSKPPNTCRTARYRVWPNVVSSAVDGEKRCRTGTVELSTRSSSPTTIATPGAASSRAY